MSTRINKFVAHSTGLSRRNADELIGKGKVYINGVQAKLGDTVEDTDKITLSGDVLTLPTQNITIMLNKPVGYVCSRVGQGHKTIYDLLPAEYNALKPVGRLDKDSSGLLLLTNDGDLANKLTHPKYTKNKVYEIELFKPLKPKEEHLINDSGVKLEDGVSQLKLKPFDAIRIKWQVIMHEGRNRQIRRTFEALGYGIKRLHRLQIGDYVLGNLEEGSYKEL